MSPFALDISNSFRQASLCFSEVVRLYTSLLTFVFALRVWNALTYLSHSSIGVTPAVSAASAIFCPCSSLPV